MHFTTPVDPKNSETVVKVSDPKDFGRSHSFEKVPFLWT